MIDNLQQKLFFIIGIGRRGTSIFQEIMNTFLGFCNAKESRILGDDKFSLWTPVRQSKDFSQLENFIEKNWTSKYFVEKTPDSILCLNELEKKYPKANYIFLERNPFDIVLSQLNMFQGDFDTLERYYHINNMIMYEDDLLLNREQYYSKMTLKQIYCQVENKNKFNNSITIQYETLKASFHSCLTLLEKTFGIKSNREAAKQKFSSTSYSSKENKYAIKKIKDTEAISNINIAKRLWNYPVTT